MDIKLEKRVGPKSVYSSFICGRKVHATTVNGEPGARRIFAIIEGQKGAAQSPPMAGGLTTTRHGR